jgi:hypothetical protein
MNPDQFIGFLEHPDTLDPESAELLDNLVREFPYCQPAQLLYLCNLFNERDLRFNQQLRIAAIYASDRRKLYELITNSHPAEKLDNTRPVPGSDTVKEPESRPPELHESEIVKQVESVLPPMEPDLVQFDYQEASGETLPEPETQNRPAPPELAPETDMSSVKRPGADLIDQFIKNSESRIIRADLELASREDLSLNSLKEDDEMLTETLAKIYIQQEYYLKAIQSYEKLSLKFPEKSVYFAGQIEMIRELIKNQ